MKTVEVSSFSLILHRLIKTQNLFKTYLPFSPADSPSGADSLFETCR